MPIFVNNFVRVTLKITSFDDSPWIRRKFLLICCFLSTNTMDQIRLEILFAVTAHVSTTRAIFRPFRGNDFVSNTGATLFCASEDYRNNEITLLT